MQIALFWRIDPERVNDRELDPTSFELSCMAGMIQASISLFLIASWRLIEFWKKNFSLINN